MQIGQNSEVSRNGRVLHIQTEDAGREHGYIVTHLFLSGNILVSERQTYHPHIDDDELRTLIKQQHRSMHQALNNGEYDRTILLKHARMNASSIPLAKDRQVKSSQSARPLAQHSTQASPPLAKDSEAPSQQQSSLSDTSLSSQSSSTSFQDDMPNRTPQAPYLRVDGLWPLSLALPQAIETISQHDDEEPEEREGEEEA